MGFPEVWQRGSQVALSLTVSTIVLLLCQSAAVTQESKPSGVPTSPAHVLNDPELFDRTMAHISDEDLIAALDLDRPGLEGVKEAAGKNTKLAIEALVAHMKRRVQPVDVITAAAYRDELRSYHRAFPNKSDSLVRLFNAMHEWSLADADRIVRGEHIYAGSKTNWVKFDGGKVDWITNHGNIFGFHYFGSLEPLMLAWLYTGEEKYAKAFADAFNDWWDQRDRVVPQRCVWYKLGLAIRGRQLVRALHHMADTQSFDVQTQTRMLKTILGSCRWLMRDWETKPAWTSNWGLFVATGLIRMGALAPEFRESESWINKGQEIMRRYAGTFKADGGTEALGYHDGILMSLIQPHRLLVMNGREGYLDDPELREGISRAMLLLARTTMPSGHSPAIGDGRYAWPAEVLSVGAHLLDDKELKSALVAIGTHKIANDGAFHVPGLSSFTTADALREQFLPRVPLEAWRPESYIFPDQGLTALRRGDSLSDMVYMAVSHGVYGHSHKDLLGITLFAHGDLLLGDPGVPSYYGPHTGEMSKSKAHNCLIVDQTDMKKVKPTMLTFDTSPAADLWRCRSTGYKSLGVINTRTIVNVKDKPSFFVVIDQVERTTSENRQLDVYYHAIGPDLRVESPRRVIVGKGPVLTIASPAENGKLRQGKEWSILLETNLISKQFPYIAYGKESAVEEYFCSVLATDPTRPREIEVKLRKGQFDSLEVDISEGPTRHLVLIAGTAGKLPDVPSQGRWRLKAGKDQTVRLFVLAAMISACRGAGAAEPIFPIPATQHGSDTEIPTFDRVLFARRPVAAPLGSGQIEQADDPTDGEPCLLVTGQQVGMRFDDPLFVTPTTQLSWMWKKQEGIVSIVQVQLRNPATGQTGYLGYAAGAWSEPLSADPTVEFTVSSEVPRQWTGVRRNLYEDMKDLLGWKRACISPLRRPSNGRASTTDTSGSASSRRGSACTDSGPTTAWSGPAARSIRTTPC